MCKASWISAEFADVESILDFIEINYEQEITGILTRSRPRMAYHLYRAVLAQTFEPWSQLVSVVKEGDKILAWAWLERGKYTPYAIEEMACAEFLHVDLALSVRERIRLVSECLHTVVL